MTWTEEDTARKEARRTFKLAEVKRLEEHPGQQFAMAMLRASSMLRCAVRGHLNASFCKANMREAIGRMVVLR